MSLKFIFILTMADTDEDIMLSSNGMDIDDIFLTEPAGRPLKIADLLQWSYALSLHPVIANLAHKYCHGCKYDPPSQIQHDVCIYKPYSEQVHEYFEEALTLVDEDYVIGHWLGNLGLLSPTVRYHEVSRYFDPSYRLEEWRNFEWRHDVKQKLLALEHHPY